MKVRIFVEIEVKNDELTREAGREDITLMLLEHLEQNKLAVLPWVVQTRYIPVKGV